jgi:hypothetical protein
MRRRYLLRGGKVMAVGSLAGCIGDIADIGDGSDATTPTKPEDESGPEPEDESDPEPEDGSDEGEVSFSVEPSASEIEWGEPYSVTVTVTPEGAPGDVATGIIFQKGSTASWSGPISDTGKRWQLDAGESQTETFDLEPSSVDDYTLGLANVQKETVIEEWKLSVTPPTAEFDETISYPNGFKMTVDAELHEWLELKLSWDGGDETGTYAVRPRDGQWVRVWATGENNSDENETLTGPAGQDFTALAGGTQLNRISGGKSVGAGTDYEIKDPTREEKGAKTKEGWEEFWILPNTGFTRGKLAPTATDDGLVLFVTDMETTKEDLKIQLKWPDNDVLVTWG